MSKSETPVKRTPLKLKAGGKKTLKQTSEPKLGPTKPTDERTPLTGATHDKLEAAAELLLSVLPNHIAETLHHFCKSEIEIPLWHYLCGIWVRCYSSGELNGYDIDPAWEEGAFGLHELICAVCKKQFKQTRIGQLVCSDVCGITYANRNRKNAAA